MSNKDLYDNAFAEALDIPVTQTEGLEYQGIAEWDSVGHMALIAELENTFDIMLETDDIIDFSSYEKGMEILQKYGVTFS